MSPLRTHLSYANVVSTLCLFILLGGAAYGAAKTVLPKHSVGTAQLKAGAVATKQIKASAVNGAKVADGSLSGADVADGSLTGTDIADGSLGTSDLADGAVNSAKVLDKSLTGNDVAPDSLTGTQINESTLGTVPNATNAANATNANDASQLGGKAPGAFISSDTYKNESPVEAGTTIGDGTQVASASCNPGDILLAGGPANIAATTTLLESFPSPGSTNSWSVRVNKNGQTDNFNVVVLCAKQ